MRREVMILKSKDLTKEECYSLIETATRNLEKYQPYDIREGCKAEIVRERDNLAAELEEKNRLIRSLTDYIEVLQKGRTPIVFTAKREEIEEVQEFIAKHVLTV